MELHEAISSLSVIRRQLVETETFRGYRALPVACSSALALVAGFLQPLLVGNPVPDVAAYVLFWSVVAAVSIGLTGLTMTLRDNLIGTSRTRAVTWLAITQFAPCLGSAALATLVIVRYAPEVSWLLPGLWQIFFSQGVFAACRLLPRLTVSVGLFYLGTGLLALGLARGEWAFHPWAMAIPFGVGQLIAAAVLYWTVERTHARS
ncbi:hypothetical protein [Zavarzinella formosa]|uniref:hypothetical protein n=1 Tax=Zavarzinella formosa TaxID=360055 RepID=UPI0002EB6B03|nr:hypothetical protein [Zavarzinella formosa]